jgi:hypothetical protein
MKFPSLVMVINRARIEDLSPSVTKVGPIAGEEGHRSDLLEDCPRV